MIGAYGAPVDILLVEDNPGDADLAREALEGSKIRNTLLNLHQFLCVVKAIEDFWLTIVKLPPNGGK